MKKQNTQSKIIIALSAIVMLLVALSATLTFAWFTANRSATSDTMTFGKLNMNSITLGLTETEDHLTSTSGIQYLVPGCTVGLSGTVGIVANIDSFVRVRIGVAVSGNAVADATTVRGALTGMPADNIPGAAPSDTLDDNNTLWTSWYYIRVAAGNGTGTAEALDLTELSFTFPNTLDNTWQNKTVNIKVEAQAIQADHLTSAANATVITGSSGDGNVTDLEAESAWTTAASQANAA